MDTTKAIMLKAIDELVKGQELTTQLQDLLYQPEAGLGPAEDLIAKISGTFCKTISVLDSFRPNSSSSSLAAVEGSQNALEPVKGKRKCNKRKKISETCTIDSTNIPEDAFSWRKYGQKVIQNAKFPRCYFRCTHKKSQGCKAKKQVEKVKEEPNKFTITLIGKHTCNTNAETPKSKTCDHHDDIIKNSEEHMSPSLTTSMKEQENNHHHGSPKENDLSLVWPEMVFEEDHHHHHHAIKVCGETGTSINVSGSPDLMVFGAEGDFWSNEKEDFSIFNSCSNLF